MAIPGKLMEKTCTGLEFVFPRGQSFRPMTVEEAF
jgi:hypothetical protein